MRWPQGVPPEQAEFSLVDGGLHAVTADDLSIEQRLLDWRFLADQQRVANALEEDAEIMSNTQLEQQLAGQPEEIQAEIIRINTEARDFALQVALLVPLLAGVIGLFNSLRMGRLPDPKPSEAAEGMVLG